MAKNFSYLFSMKNLLLFLIIYSIIANSQINSFNIPIARDNFGVPHLFSPPDPDVAFGIVWSHSEDDFGTLHTVVKSVKEMLGMVLGKKEAGTV